MSCPGKKQHDQRAENPNTLAKSKELQRMEPAPPLYEKGRGMPLKREGNSRACELLVGRSLGEQKVEGLQWMTRERATRSSNEGGTRSMNERNSQIATSRQNLGSVGSRGYESDLRQK